MVLEIAQIDVKNGQEELFEAAVARAVHLFQRAKGCRGMRLHRSIEVPTRYRLLVEWDHLEDHTVHFRGSTDFQEWRKLVGDHFASPPAVEHTNELALGF